MRRVWIAAVLAACGRIGFDPVPSGAASSTLSLDRLDPGETLVDFPLPVTLDATHVASDLLDGSASNVRFFDASGTVLADEIEQIGPPLVAWVRVPQIVGTTTILTAEVGDELPPPSTESVWSASYAAVYHLTNAAIDSTTNHRDGTAIGNGAIAMVAGAIASAGSFDGVSQAYIISGAVDLPALTVSAWIQTTDSAVGFQTLMTRPVPSSNFDDFFLGTEAGRQYVETCVGSGNNVATAATEVASGQWMHLAVTADTATLVPYLNGAVSAPGVATGMALDNDTTPMLIGCDEGLSNQPNENFLHGAVDEVRVEQVVRSANWLHYDDAAQRDMVITYGQVSR